MSARVTACLLALAAGCLLAATPAAEASSASATACPRAQGLTLARKLGSTSALLRWRQPARLPRSAAGFRVYRNGVVVGQTRARRLRVRVSPGRKVTLAVRIALRDGSTVRCRAVIVRRIRWRAPTAPRNVIVRDDPAGLLVTWTRSKRGEGRLVGYRVYRDAAAVSQVTTTRAVVPLPPLRSAVIRVAAVDNRGKLSPLSRPTVVQRGHTAPSTPVDLAASAASDREVDLSWSPSVVANGARVSYRVQRDGRLVAHTSSTGLRIGNLFPARTYSFVVTAVDSLGYASADSAPVSVTTQRPVQASGGTFAFLLASTDRSFAALQAHYRQIGTVVPTYFDCRSDGTFEGRDDPLVTGWARLRGVRVHARWNCQRTVTLSHILRDTALREAALAGIMQTVVANGYDGANLDFEAGAAADRAALTSFVRDLAGRLHAAGKELSVDVSAKVKDVPNHPRSTFYDYDALAQSADAVIVMSWGIHWSTSAPGAIDALPWATAVASYVASRPQREKFVLGYGLYGIDWPAGGGTAHPGTPLEHADVMRLAASVGATPVVDPLAQAPTFRYTAADGVPHEVWYVDAASLAQRFALAQALGLRVAVWRLGNEDAAVWSLPALAP